MEILLVLGIIAGAAYALNHHAASSSAPPGTTPPPGNGTPPPGGTGTQPPPPAVVPKPPGLYPAGTPGTYPIDCTVLNSDGYGQLIVTPGGVVGPETTATFWYGAGTVVNFKAQLMNAFPPPIFSAFDHFDGPGVSTRQNPFSVPISGRGFVTAVFAFLGQT